MTVPDVRAAVDAAIRNHLDARRSTPATEEPRSLTTPSSNGPSHGRFGRAVLPGDPPDGRCVLEPSVECTGCGYCESHGH